MEFKDQSTGTGLGLYTVNTIMENYGGTVETSRSDMGGACFEISLDWVD